MLKPTLQWRKQDCYIHDLHDIRHKVRCKPSLILTLDCIQQSLSKILQVPVGQLSVRV